MSQTRAQLVKGFTNTSAPADVILVDSNGNVGINATPEAWSGFDALEVNEASIVSSGSGDAFFTANAYYDGAWKYKDAGVARNIYMNSDGIVFRTAPSGSADGAISWTEVGRWREGGGLCFNGDTAAANGLDDYEEGTFTPTINSGFTASYDSQAGRYTKVGNVVHFFINIDLSSISGSSSDTYAEVEGLPFTSTNTGNIDNAVTVAWQMNLGNSVEYAYIEQNTTAIVLLGEPSGGSRTHWNPGQVWDDNNGKLALSGTYTTTA